jgi:hypothetical protein
LGISAMDPSSFDSLASAFLYPGLSATLIPSDD